MFFGFVFFLNDHYQTSGQSWWIDTPKSFLGNQVENVTEHNIIWSTDAEADLAEEKGSSMRHTWEENVTQIFHLATGQRGAKVSNPQIRISLSDYKPSAVIMNWCESPNIWIQDKRTRFSATLIHRENRTLPLFNSEQWDRWHCLLWNCSPHLFAVLSVKYVSPVSSLSHSLSACFQYTSHGFQLLTTALKTALGKGQACPEKLPRTS